MSRVAHCQCGSFRVIVEGEPLMVNICHCDQCKRRTGSNAAPNAYFLKEQVRTEGKFRVFSRDGGDGRKVHIRFCPECGTSVCWLLDFRPDCYGVAVGAFADPEFPPPSRSVWEENMMAWTTLPPRIEHFARMPAPPPKQR